MYVTGNPRDVRYAVSGVVDVAKECETARGERKLVTLLAFDPAVLLLGNDLHDDRGVAVAAFAALQVAERNAAHDCCQSNEGKSPHHRWTA